MPLTVSHLHIVPLNLYLKVIKPMTCFLSEFTIKLFYFGPWPRPSFASLKVCHETAREREREVCPRAGDGRPLSHFGPWGAEREEDRYLAHPLRTHSVEADQSQSRDWGVCACVSEEAERRHTFTLPLLFCLSNQAPGLSQKDHQVKFHYWL